MAKKSNQPIQLSRNDIILGAESDIIKQALEARIEIDRLLEERAQAYKLIAELEGKVNVLLEEDTFPFPQPEMPVAGFGAGPAKKAAKKVAKPAPVEPEVTEEKAEDEEAPEAADAKEESDDKEEEQSEK
ncbi:hypothetical protein [Rubellicoccus peritrichatus]|uniref:Uncharacterized protein n=1 Tax=Rubellicoccus peritrichatus TaxID=3080537 RepID=A0AAQ3LCK1_9BACT|nr:hypothetical protein [Puniceicoccus sp. CR14]WOO42882.1 hypothetical protein RZN69_07240 [Puniceicoccus sp. CR14]